jgi:hypothetical protein
MSVLDEHLKIVEAELAHAAGYPDLVTTWNNFKTEVGNASDTLQQSTNALHAEWMDDAGDALQSRTERARGSLQVWRNAPDIAPTLDGLKRNIQTARDQIEALKAEYDQLAATTYNAADVEGGVAAMGLARQAEIPGISAGILKALGQQLTDAGSAISGSAPTVPWTGPESTGAPAATRTAGGASPAGAGPNGANPAGATPAGVTPAGASPAGATPAGATPGGAPGAANPGGATSGGATPGGATPAGAVPGGPGATPPGGPDLSGMPTAPSPVAPPAVTPPPSVTPPRPVIPPPLPPLMLPPRTNTPPLTPLPPGASGVKLPGVTGGLGGLGGGGSRGAVRPDLGKLNTVRPEQLEGSGGSAQATRSLTGRALTPPAEAPVPPAASAPPVAQGNNAGRMTPPMMPPTGLGGSSTGGPRPGTADRQAQGRQAQGRSKPASGVPGVPPKLRGRSGQATFPVAAAGKQRKRQETEEGTVQLLDEELWQVEAAPTPPTPATAAPTPPRRVRRPSA